MVDFIHTYADRTHHGKEEDILFESLEKSVSCLTQPDKLIDFYPKHISKEDEHFCPDTERHEDKAELDAMLKEFYDFDMQMIHEKYRETVEAVEKERQKS